MPEISVEKYRREATACRLKAEETVIWVDKDAWLKLADDWDKLAQGMDLKEEWPMTQAMRPKSSRVRS